MLGAIKNLFKGNTPAAENTVVPAVSPKDNAPLTSGTDTPVSKPGVLNLRKNETICLRKKEDTTVKSIKVSCGWKAGVFSSMDVDIAAHTGTGAMSFFGSHEGIPGVRTSEDVVTEEKTI
jgi:hypothetical protein